MTEFTAKEVFDIINKLNTNISDGFSGVYKKIDTVCEKYDNALNDHDKRITNVTSDLRVHSALNGAREEADKEGRDYWKYIIRGTSLTAILALIGLIVKYIA